MPCMPLRVHEMHLKMVDGFFYNQTLRSSYVTTPVHEMQSAFENGRSWLCQTQAPSSSRAGWGDSEGRHKPLLGVQTSRCCRSAVQFLRWLLFGENSCAITLVCVYRGVLTTRWFLYVWEPWVLYNGCGPHFVLFFGNVKILEKSRISMFLMTLHRNTIWILKKEGLGTDVWQFDNRRPLSDWYWKVS
jgi:hypothetical protein